MCINRLVVGDSTESGFLVVIIVPHINRHTPMHAHRKILYSLNGEHLKLFIPEESTL